MRHLLLFLRKILMTIKSVDNGDPDQRLEQLNPGYF